MAELSRLRLLVAGIRWPPETFLGRLIDGLAAAGIQVTVACRQRPQDRGRGATAVDWLPAPAWGRHLGPTWAKSLGITWRACTRGARDLAGFRRHVRQIPRWRDRLHDWNALLPFTGRRWDILYFPWNEAAIRSLPLFDLGMPVVVSCRGAHVNIAPHNPRRQAVRGGLSHTFARARAVHCVSTAIQAEAVAHGLDPAKSWIIRPAVDPDCFSPAVETCRGSGEFTVVTTGSLIWRKGLEYALQAIRFLVDRGVRVRFEIIGEGEERQRVRYTCQDLGLMDRVEVRGNVAPAQVVDRLRQADAFLLSSLSEGISNAVLEAMACGLPVVTTDCGGMREAVTDGVEGFVVPVRDAQAMASALEILVSRPPLRQEMGQAGRTRIQREFTLDQQIRRWVELLQAVRGPSSRPTGLAVARVPQPTRAIDMVRS